MSVTYIPAYFFFFRNNNRRTMRDTEFTSVYTQSLAMSCWSTWSAYRNCLWQATIKSCDKWKPPMSILQTRTLSRGLPFYAVTFCALINAKSGISFTAIFYRKVTHVVAGGRISLSHKVNLSMNSSRASYPVSHLFMDLLRTNLRSRLNISVGLTTSNWTEYACF